MPALEAALSEAMQGSLSNELDESTFNGAAGELNGLFVQATNVNAAGAVETYTTGIGRFAALVDGRHAYTLADVRAVIGSKTFALYAGVFANTNKGDVSLFDYLTRMLGSIRVSDRVPGVSSSAQKGICVLAASAEMPKIHVWDAMQIVRDPYSWRGRWQGHDHRDGAGQSALRAARHEPDRGNPSEAALSLWHGSPCYVGLPGLGSPSGHASSSTRIPIRCLPTRRPRGRWSVASNAIRRRGCTRCVWTPTRAWTWPATSGARLRGTGLN